MRALAIVLALAGCDKVFLGKEVLTTEDISLLPFGTPIPFANLNTAAEEDRGTFTDDLLELYFHRAREIFVAKRARVEDELGVPVAVAELSQGFENIRACISGDGLRIYFSRRMQVGDDALIHVATRASRSEPFGAPRRLDELVALFPDGDEFCGWENAARTSMMISTTFFATQDLVRVDRRTPDGPFESYDELDDFNSDQRDGAPWADAEATLVVFDRLRVGEATLHQGTLQGTRYAVRPLEELALGRVGSPWLSKDGRTIVFTHDNDLYTATR